MQDYQQDFIAFCLDNGVLGFGGFTLKSGRKSPYFFNSGLFEGGQALSRLGCWYARAVQAASVDFHMLYGPAYKGIPLVAATAIAFAREFGRDVPFCFNRKVAKDHGEGGAVVGTRPRGRVLIIDDVLSAGTSARESVGIIESAGATPAGLVIALDRQERGMGSRSAVQELEATLGIPVISIIELDHLVAFLAEKPEMAGALARIRDYRTEYGA